MVVNKASGNVIVFLDSDVKSPANFAEKLQETFKNPQVVGATCHIMPLNGNFTEKAFFKFYNNILRATSKFKPHARGEFYAVRKKAYQQLGGFDETLPCLEDHELAYRLAKLGKFVFINDLTVYESMRRFRKLGFSKVLRTWTIDYIFFMLRGKPVTKVWQPAR
jgi:GT2 family glycosyltransferase